MEYLPPDYQSEAQYAAYQTGPTDLSSPYTSLHEWQALAWPPHSSTASTAPLPPSLPVASSSVDPSSASSLAAAFGGYQYPYYASNFTTSDPFAPSVLRQPLQTPHIVEAPLTTTVAPQLTWGAPPTYTPTYSSPVLTQQDKTPTPRPPKRHREEAEDLENLEQGLTATTGKKRRAASAKSRFHNPLADIAEPQSSQHAAPLRVGDAPQKRQSQERSTRPLSQDVENIPILDDILDSFGYMQGGRAETRSRSRALALASSARILSATSHTDVPNFNPPIGVGVAAPVPPGEHTWYTPGFYEELRDIASALVAQNHASTSGASDGVVHHGPRIDEDPPVTSLPGAPRAKRRRASIEEPPIGWREVVSDDGHCAEGNPGSTAGVAQERFLCPFADSSGLCNKPETKKRPKKRPKIAVSAPDNGASQGSKASELSTFSRQTDLERHVLSRHLKAHVHCKRCFAANRPSKFVRYDGFLRHLRQTCFKGIDKSVQSPKEFAFILMPCYRDPGGLFVKTLSGLQKTRTALSFEESQRKITKDIRRCECCRKLDDEEMDAIRASPLGVEDPGVQPISRTVYASAGLDEDRLPPEEEEGVDEEPISESNLDVGPPVSSTGCGDTGFPGLEEQENGQWSSSQRGEVPADDDEKIRRSDLDSTFYESVESLDRLLAHPWIDFGLEAQEPDETWMGLS